MTLKLLCVDKGEGEKEREGERRGERETEREGERRREEEGGREGIRKRERVIMSSLTSDEGEKENTN